MGRSLRLRRNLVRRGLLKSNNDLPLYITMSIHVSLSPCPFIGLYTWEFLSSGKREDIIDELTAKWNEKLRLSKYVRYQRID